MKYDDASWHYGGNFPDNLAQESAATHIGIFVAWCLMNGLAGEMHTNEFPEALQSLIGRNTTPGKWFIEHCDEKFTDEDLNEQGNKFTEHYYNPEDAEYFESYESTLANGFETFYEVPDTWDTYDKIAPVIKLAFAKWSGQN